MAANIWTFSDIKTATRRYAKLKDETAFSNTELEKAINQYYFFDFVLDLKPPELIDYWEFNTTATDESEPLDDDTIVTIRDYGRVANFPFKIFFSEEEFFSERWPPSATVANDRPIEGLFMGGTLIMRPIPDAIYAVKIPAWVRPLTLTTDAQIPTREEWGPLISIGAARMLAGQFGDEKRFKFLNGLFDQEYSKLTYKAFEQATSKRIKPKW